MLLVLSGALLAFEEPVEAQTDSVRLSRTAAQERAITHSAELARRTVAGVEARQLEQVPYAYNPELAIEIEGTPAPWSSRDYTRRVLLEQEIDLRGERRARSRMGQATSAVAQRELGERAQEISAMVDQAYSRHLVAQRRVALLEPLRDRARGLQSKAENARRRGTLTGFDARLLRAEALGIEADWLEAQRELEVAAAELRGWLVMPADAPLDLEDDLDERPWRCGVDSALAMAAQSRLGLARAAAAESLALARVALEQRLARGNLTLGASLSRERFELEPAGSEAISDKSMLVGLQVRVPIPIFGRNQPGIAEARLELEHARAERAVIDREVWQDIVGGCAALDRFEEQRTLRARAAEAAAHDLVLIESAYADGRIPLDEYITLRERLVRQQLQLLDALAAVEEQRARLVRATGVGRTELARRWGGER